MIKRRRLCDVLILQAATATNCRKLRIRLTDRLKLWPPVIKQCLLSVRGVLLYTTTLLPPPPQTAIITMNRLRVKPPVITEAPYTHASLFAVNGRRGEI